MNGELFLVGTPIGNLKDITFRAVEILNHVDYIACEDTRHSLPLLNAYDIKKPLLSCHMHNERESAEKILNLIKDGKNIALITDAGMPCISDPGAIVVDMAYAEGIKVSVVPGASAVISALALSGITKKGFCFLGFLPEKTKDKNSLVRPYINIDIQLVFYSAPHNVNNDLEYLFSVLGERNVVVVKEITKLFERAERGLLSELRIEQPRGEYVIITEGVDEVCKQASLSIEEHYKFHIKQGLSKKEAIKITAKERGVAKDDIYKIAINLD